MEADDLTSQIDRHADDIAALGRKIDAVVQHADELTQEARARLAEYQKRKREAGHILAEAGERFTNAQRALGAVEGLLRDIEAIKTAHVTLTRELNRFLIETGDGPESRELVAAFRRQRQTLRRQYGRIVRCRHDARRADQTERDGEAK
jgi:chromosome segregation ATPase